MADKALREAKERVNSALKNSGVKPPNRENRKITINLAPADVKKNGSQYDLAIAIGYLLATKQIQQFEARDKIFLGELALDGRLRPINGALNIAEMAGGFGFGFDFIFVPKENAREAAAIKNIRVIPVETLREAIDFLEGRKNIVPEIFSGVDGRCGRGHAQNHGRDYDNDNAPDFSEIKGQENAKRALTIAAAGGHNILMSGPPGVGKSFLARAFAGILPDLSLDEAIEITKIWSAAGINPGGLIRSRPFRSPHQTASMIAIVGGGQDPRPGEISLAHRGVLFLDELPEFSTKVLEALRQPIESGLITISRAKESLVFPAKFTLAAAMNPCPCGYYGDPEKDCKCSAYEVIKYQKKISGPLLDRIDLQVKLGRIKIEELRKGERGAAKDATKNGSIKASVERARRIQRKRFARMSIDGSANDGDSGNANGGGASKTNSEMSSREAQEIIKLDRDSDSFLQALDKNRLSPRGYYRLLKVARTIADLEEKDSVTVEHLAEAFSYRIKEEI